MLGNTFMAFWNNLQLVLFISLSMKFLWYHGRFSLRNLQVLTTFSQNFRYGLWRIHNLSTVTYLLNGPWVFWCQWVDWIPVFSMKSQRNLKALTLLLVSICTSRSAVHVWYSSQGFWFTLLIAWCNENHTTIFGKSKFSPCSPQFN